MNLNASIDSTWLRIALEQATAGVSRGQAPFGACIVKGPELIAAACNVMWESIDITAHAEVTAIRLACASLQTVDLSGCTIYSTTEPCPMCFAACHWARLDRIVYGSSIPDANAVGLSNLPISNIDMKRLGSSPIQLHGSVLREDCVALLQRWHKLRCSGDGVASRSSSI